MLEFLTENKEWIFSGIGVAILGLVFAAARHFLSSRAAGGTMTQSQRAGTQATAIQAGRDIIVNPPPPAPSAVVRVHVHRAFVVGDPRERYFINVVNTSNGADVHLTHVWYQGSRRVDVLEPSRPLPQRLRPSQPWETHVLVSLLPDDPDVLRNFRVRISTGEVFTSEPNPDVPPIGYISG